MVYKMPILGGLKGESWRENEWINGNKVNFYKLF